MVTFKINLLFETYCNSCLGHPQSTITFQLRHTGTTEDVNYPFTFLGKSIFRTKLLSIQQIFLGENIHFQQQHSVSYQENSFSRAFKKWYVRDRGSHS